MLWYPSHLIGLDGCPNDDLGEELAPKVQSSI